MSDPIQSKIVKLNDLFKTNGSISTVSYSHKYRVSSFKSNLQNLAIFDNHKRIQVYLC